MKFLIEGLSVVSVMDQFADGSIAMLDKDEWGMPLVFFLRQRSSIDSIFVESHKV